MSTKWAWKAIQPRKLCSPVPLSDMTEVDDVKKKKKRTSSVVKPNSWRQWTKEVL